MSKKSIGNLFLGAAIITTIQTLITTTLNIS